MKKLAIVLLVAGACSFAVVPVARAGDPALVKVPFQFIVGERVLPAGEYRIEPQTSDATVLMVTNTAKGQASAFAVAPSTGLGAAPGTLVHVAFKNFSGQYFLWQITMPGRDTQEVKLTKKQAEQTLVRLNLMPAERADVAK
jgi:hypothetical protein